MPNEDKLDPSEIKSTILFSFIGVSELLRLKESLMVLFKKKESVS